MCNNPQFIIVSGYFNSGSSAVVDLLKEYKDVYECGSEIRFISDPYGIIELERALIDDWNWIRAAMAVDDFLSYIKKCARVKSYNPFACFGMGYAKYINPAFVSITENYINRISEYTFTADFYAFKAKKNYFKYVFDRCSDGIDRLSHGKIAIKKPKQLVYAHPSKELFYSETRNYIDSLFSYVVNKEKKNLILLDQAIHPRDLCIVKNYFNNAKMIIVERDIRDMFAQSIISGDFKYTNSTSQGEEFIRLQKSFRENLEKSSDVYIVRFEELITNKYKVAFEIEQYLGLDHKTHIYDSKFLKTEESIKNIGIWRKVYDDYNKAFDYINNCSDRDIFDFYDNNLIIGGK